MSNILTQEEIDALLEVVDENEDVVKDKTDITTVISEFITGFYRFIASLSTDKLKIDKFTHNINEVRLTDDSILVVVNVYDQDAIFIISETFVNTLVDLINEKNDYYKIREDERSAIETFINEYVNNLELNTEVSLNLYTRISSIVINDNVYISEVTFNINNTTKEIYIILNKSMYKYYKEETENFIRDIGVGLYSKLTDVDDVVTLTDNRYYILDIKNYFNMLEDIFLHKDILTYNGYKDIYNNSINILINSSISNKSVYITEENYNALIHMFKSLMMS